MYPTGGRHYRSAAPMRVIENVRFYDTMFLRGKSTLSVFKRDREILASNLINCCSTGNGIERDSEEAVI